MQTARSTPGITSKIKSSAQRGGLNYASLKYQIILDKQEKGRGTKNGGTESDLDTWTVLSKPRFKWPVAVRLYNRRAWQISLVQKISLPMKVSFSLSMRAVHSIEHLSIAFFWCVNAQREYEMSYSSATSIYKFRLQWDDAVLCVYN